MVDDKDDNDTSANYVPAYNLAISPHEKNRLLAEKDFNAIKTIVDASHFLASHKDDFTDTQKDTLQNGMRFLLKSASSILQERVDLERQDKNPEAEGMLRQIVDLSGSDQDDDVKYGPSVSMSLMLLREAQGMSPDAEDNVREFLERNGLDDDFDVENNNAKKMR